MPSQKGITHYTNATTDGNTVLLGDPNGDKFDKMIREMRGLILIESMESAVKNLPISYFDFPHLSTAFQQSFKQKGVYGCPQTI